MARPSLEMADIVLAAGQQFIKRSRHWLSGQHLKVLRAIRSCRTAVLGWHVDECTRCGYTGHSYNSCRNRHCPKCQANARLRWIEGRSKELLPVSYAHVVFTVPRLLAQLALQNKKLIYTLLMRLSAETLIEVARNPKRLGAEIGFFSVLHTWTQKLEHHPHVHCVVPAGGLSLDHQRWIPVNPKYRFFLPKKVLQKVFRAKLREALNEAFAAGKIGFYGNWSHLSDPEAFRAFVRALFRHEWVVYCKPPFGGPEYVLRYLGLYTHRVAISNHRLVSFANGEVTFLWRDHTHGNREQPMTLPVDRFLGRFLFHVLPKGFVRIRSFGYLANRRRGLLLPLCFQLLESRADTFPTETQSTETPCLWRCPECGSPMIVTLWVNPPLQLTHSPPLASTVWE